MMACRVELRNSNVAQRCVGRDTDREDEGKRMQERSRGGGGGGDGRESGRGAVMLGLGMVL